MKIGIAGILFAIVVLAFQSLYNQTLLRRAWSREGQWQSTCEALVTAKAQQISSLEKSIAALEKTITLYQGGQ